MRIPGLYTAPRPNLYKFLATPAGFEPATSCVTGKRSSRLNYEAIFISLIFYYLYIIIYFFKKIKYVFLNALKIRAVQAPVD